MRRLSNTADSAPTAEEHESEVRFQLAAAGANDGIWDWDLVNNQLFFSKRLKAILGHEDLDNEPDAGQWLRRIHPDDAPPVASAIAALVYGKGGDRFENEHRLRHKDGTYRWVLLRGLLIRDASGKPSRMAGSLTDITERKRVEAALVESEQRFRALIEHSSDLISLIARDGTFTYLGPSVKSIMGYDPAELVGRHALEIVHPEDLPLAIETLADLVNRPGGSAIGVSRCRHKDGSWRWLEAIGTNFLSEASFQAIIVNSRDVTDRKRAEEELREREERLRTIFEEGPLGMCFVGIDNRLLQVNDTFCRIVGRRAEDLVGRTFVEITHPDDLERNLDLTARLLSGEMTYGQLEKRYIRGDGEPVWVNLTASLIRDAQGAPLYGIGMIHDITDRRRAEAEAQERMAELAHVLRVSTVNEMAATLAHEINQPLAAIINYAKGCARRLQAGDAVPRQLARIQDDIVDEALRAAEVIRRLRDLLRKEPPRRELLQANDVVRGVVELVQAEARAHRVALRMDLAEGLPPVQADRIQIEQVVLNLIRNGVEAMEEASGKREVRVSTRPADDGYIEVAVCDSGIGLPAAAAEQVFTPFFTTKPSGLGMGLSISRLIVEAHGGRVWATPQLQHGTTFRFTLPAAPV